MQFFNLNIKSDDAIFQIEENGGAIKLQNPKIQSAAEFFMGEGLAVVFYDVITVENIKSGNFYRTLYEKWQANQIGDLHAFLNFSKNSDNIGVTIDNGKIWVYRPVMDSLGRTIYDFRDCQNTDKKRVITNEFPKAIPIEFLTAKINNEIISLKGLPLSQVPLVLASIKSNQYFSRGTCKEIDPSSGKSSCKGNVAAILAKFGMSDQIQDICEDLHPFECLSSIEFETLVAKLFEELGCFVPAYKGGFLKDIDLFVSPSETFSLKIEGIDEEIQFSAGEKYSIQCKLNATSSSGLNGFLGRKNCLLFSAAKRGGETKPQKNTFYRDDITKMLGQCKNTNNWLQRSLDWTPKETLDKLSKP